MFPRLLLLFILVPVIEFALFMAVSPRIGGLWPTIAIIVLTGIVGASLTKQQGLKTFLSFQKATAEGRMPHAEIMDGLMILIAGAVLLTPGFLTDAIGFALLFPPVRAIVRKIFGDSLKARVQVVGMPTADSPATSPNLRGEDVVIDVEAEVIDEKTS